MQARKNDQGLYEVDIDGHVYEFQKWGAERAFDTLMDLSAICGRPFGQMVSGMFGRSGAGLQTELDGDFIGQLIGQLSSAFYERRDLCRSLIKELSTGTDLLCDGAPVRHFNLHYKECLERVFKVARVNLEVQYERFFSAARDVADQAGKKLKTPPTSTKATSPGSTGESS